MSGKFQKLHIVDNAIPYAAHSPIPVPHHWKEEVQIKLQKNVEMGILQKVPVEEPTEWCMQMVVVPQKMENHGLLLISSLLPNSV